MVADRYPNFSICGIPYHVAGDVADWRALAHRSAGELAAAGLELMCDSTAGEVDVAGHRLYVRGPDGTSRWLPYDRLVIATGAVPVRPPISGLDSLGPREGVHLLHTMGDTFTLTDDLTARSPRSALIVGAGYIGLEMAEALRTRGLAVTMVERLPQVLPTVDPELGALVAAELAGHGVQVVTGTTVTAVTRTAGGLAVDGVRGGDRPFRQVVDLALVVVGVRPDTGVAAAGARVGAGRAIAVEPRCAPACPACLLPAWCTPTTGCCPTDLPAAGQHRPQAGPGRRGDRGRPSRRVRRQPRHPGGQGLRPGRRPHRAARRAGGRGRPPAADGGRPRRRPQGLLPGRHPDRDAVDGDRRTGRLLGVQLVGRRPAEIAKRVDVAAAAAVRRADRRAGQRPGPVLHPAAGQSLGRAASRRPGVDPHCPTLPTSLTGRPRPPGSAPGPPAASARLRLG